MIQRLKKAKENKKGFTLVELIVVLVILAILIALLVPALTGYINKANEKKVGTEARNALMAAQTLASEKYAEKSTSAGYEPTFGASADIKLTDVQDLAETPKAPTSVTCNAQGQVATLVYTNKGYTATYTKANDTQWVISNDNDTDDTDDTDGN